MSKSRTWKGRIGALVVPLVMGCFTLGAVAASAADPSALIEGNTIVYRGLAPGAELAIIGAARRLDDWTPVVLGDLGRAIDDDRDGVARYEPPFVIPRQSVWVAVDTADGDIVLAAPTGTPVRELAVTGGARIDGALPGTSQLRVAGRLLHWMIVRPGIGAWTAVVGDGGPDDADAQSDGMLSLTADETSGLDAATVPLEDFENDDVLVLVDPRSLRVAVAGLDDPAFAQEGIR